MPPLIQIKNLRKTFGNTVVLADVNLNVKRNEIKVIMGPSGQGKSTLLRCINRLEGIDSGNIYFDGVDIYDSKLDIHLLRQKIGFVFQNLGLYRHLSVKDNITLALRKLRGLSRRDAEEKAAIELKRLDMSGHENKFPSQLSGGQQQRVAIARALAMDPAILLLDEPTSALDPVLSRELSQLLLQLNGSKITLLCVTHDISFARSLSSQVTFLNQGVIHEGSSLNSLSTDNLDEVIRTFLSEDKKY